MMRFAALSAVFTGLSVIVAIGAFIAVLVIATGRARTFGALGVALTLVALLPGPLGNLFLHGVGGWGFLVFQALSNLLNLAGFAFMVLAIILGSRDSAATNAKSDGGWNPPQQGYAPPQDYGQQNPQQWG